MKSFKPRHLLAALLVATGLGNLAYFLAARRLK